MNEKGLLCSMKQDHESITWIQDGRTKTKKLLEEHLNAKYDIRDKMQLEGKIENVHMQFRDMDIKYKGHSFPWKT